MINDGNLCDSRKGERQRERDPLSIVAEEEEVRLHEILISDAAFTSEIKPRLFRDTEHLW